MFLFAICQAGSERALKDELATRAPNLRFAFSRPGFVTFRDMGGENGAAPAVTSVFARTSGVSLAKVAGEGDGPLAHAFWSEVARHWQSTDLAAFRHLHVWQRDPVLPGDEGFDPALPGPAMTAGALLDARPNADAWTPQLNSMARAGERIIDCILLEPTLWWLGWHIAGSVETRWVGGVPPLVAPRRMISRAYLKILEALAWSELPISPGDHCVEIGSSPGGACLALLERGAIVTGIDPAEMDPLVLAQPGFTHLRARAKDVKRSVFRDCRWLVMDANVAPKYTLDAIEDIVTAPRVRPEGLVLTLKLTNPALALELPAFAARIGRWGYGTVRMRQLAFNRQEICVVATAPPAAGFGKVQARGVAPR